MFRNYRFLLFFIFFSNHSFGQSEIRFKNYTINDGLSQSSALCIIQDDLNSLWIGTQDGLNRFDGKTFEVFTSDETSGLESEYIRCAIKDKEGNLWFGTNNGLTVYNKQTEKSNETSLQSPKLFKDGKSSFVLGNYDKAIELFLSHLNTSPSDKSLADTQLWLGRSYFYSESYLASKNAYLDFQVLGVKHPKYADSLYELSRVHIELNETNEAKKLLTQMLKDYPNHLLFNKASTLIQSL